MCKLKFIISVLFFCASSILIAQENDFEFWISGSYDHSVSKTIDFKIKQEFRLDDNASRLKKSYTTFRLDFDVNSWLRFQANYRFILNRRSNGLYGHRHRVMADLVLSPISKRFGLSNRVRFQSEVRTLNYSEKYGFSPANSLRNTIKVNYRINRMYRPYADLDLRFLLRDARTPYHVGFDRHRVRVGLEITHARKRTIDVYFLQSLHWNIKDPMQRFALGINYAWGGEGRLTD